MRLTLTAAAASVVAACTVLLAQAPGPADAPAPGFDISGYWTAPLQEDSMERGAGPELGDYGGFPINEAARLFALSYDASRVTLRHHQCDGYVAPYSIRSIGNARAWEERDPHTQRLIAIHWYNQTFEGHRTIWMDGRPHPPAWAPHTWMGFSTGRFVGQALEVQTTHLKQGWLRRNGLPESDQATMVEFFVRHGDHLTHTSVISDPVYLAEPEIRSTDFARQPTDHQTWLFACDDGEQILDRAADRVPNYAFGENPFVNEMRDRYKIPAAAYLGGPETSSPDLLPKLASLTEADGVAKTRPAAGPPSTSRAVDPQPRDGDVHVWPLRGGLFPGRRLRQHRRQIGDEARCWWTAEPALAEDAGPCPSAQRQAVQYILNTGFQPEHTGGNVALRASGGTQRPRVVLCAPVRRRGRRRDDPRASERAESHGRRQTCRGRSAERHVPAGAPSDISQRRCDRDVLGAARRHRRRQHRPLPPRGRHRHG